MSMKNILAGLVLALAAVPAAHATTISFNFATATAAGQQGASISNGGVVANARQWNGSDWVESALYVRNQTNDHGIGVCATWERPTGGLCPGPSGGGDVNELDNAGGGESIWLENQNGGAWTQLWVSSLDSGDSDGAEMGLLKWLNPDGVTYGSAWFSYGTTAGKCNVECNLIGTGILQMIDGSVFNANSRWMYFEAYGAGGNDYLVWKGVVDVPEPATLGLLGLGLAGIGFGARRRKA